MASQNQNQSLPEQQMAMIRSNNHNHNNNNDTSNNNGFTFGIQQPQNQPLNQSLNQNNNGNNNNLFPNILPQTQQDQILIQALKNIITENKNHNSKLLLTGNNIPTKKQSILLGIIFKQIKWFIRILILIPCLLSPNQLIQSMLLTEQSDTLSNSTNSHSNIHTLSDSQSILNISNITKIDSFGQNANSKKCHANCIINNIDTNNTNLLHERNFDEIVNTDSETYSLVLFINVLLNIFVHIFELNQKQQNKLLSEIIARSSEQINLQQIGVLLDIIAHSFEQNQTQQNKLFFDIFFDIILREFIQSQAQQNKLLLDIIIHTFTQNPIQQNNINYSILVTITYHICIYIYLQIKTNYIMFVLNFIIISNSVSYSILIHNYALYLESININSKQIILVKSQLLAQSYLDLFVLHFSIKFNLVMYSVLIQNYLLFLYLEQINKMTIEMHYHQFYLHQNHIKFIINHTSKLYLFVVSRFLWYSQSYVHHFNSNQITFVQPHFLAQSQLNLLNWVYITLILYIHYIILIFNQINDFQISSNIFCRKIIVSAHFHP